MRHLDGKRTLHRDSRVLSKSLPCLPLKHQLSSAMLKPVLSLRILDGICSAGLELASSFQAQSGQPGMILMLLTAAAIVALKNTGLGFLAGADKLPCQSICV